MTNPPTPTDSPTDTPTEAHTRRRAWRVTSSFAPAGGVRITTTKVKTITAHAEYRDFDVLFCILDSSTPRGGKYEVEHFAGTELATTAVASIFTPHPAPEEGERFAGTLELTVTPCAVAV